MLVRTITLGIKRNLRHVVFCKSRQKYFASLFENPAEFCDIYQNFVRSHVRKHTPEVSYIHFSISDGELDFVRPPLRAMRVITFIYNIQMNKAVGWVESLDMFLAPFYVSLVDLEAEVINLIANLPKQAGC